MLNFLGYGAAFAVKNKNTSAYIIKGNELYLFDCGESVFASIMKNNILQNISKVNIILTHFHTDHCGSLGTLVFYLSAIGLSKDSIKIIYPNKDKLSQLIHLFNIEDECSLVCGSQIKELNLKPVPQKHYNITSYGYIFLDNDKLCYFSGDTCEIPTLVLNAFLDDKIENLYIDTRLGAKNEYHITLEELKNLIPYNLRPRVICMHLADNCVRNMITNENFSFAGDLFVENFENNQ